MKLVYMSKLGLGTAQFGLDYGIANRSGQIKFSDAKNILQLAKQEKIDLIDTAILYGKSEKIIGNIGIIDFKFVSKLPNLPRDNENIESWVEDNVQRSLTQLGIKSLYGLLLHRSENLLGKSGKKLIDALKKIKASGLIKNIGISIYDPSELNKVMHLTKIDIVQAPLNIVDRRLEISGWLSTLHKEKVEIHSRSVFLQGLLLMPYNKVPSKFDKWSGILKRWSLNLKKNNLSAVEACLSYPLSLTEVDRVIVGVDSLDQFKNLIKISQDSKLKQDWSFMISNDQMLINPSNWSRS